MNFDTRRGGKRRIYLREENENLFCKSIHKLKGADVLLKFI